jgi:hypothetical protein
MRRTLKAMLNVATVASALLFFGFAGMWVRSHRQAEVLLTYWHVRNYPGGYSDGVVYGPVAIHRILEISSN